jgi:rod shape-determining protein MreD
VAYAIGIPGMILLAVLQSAVVSHLRLVDGQADVVLVAVVAWGLAGRSTESMVFGLVGGIILDLLSALPIGTTSLVLVLIAYLVSLTEGRLWGTHLLTPLAVFFAASLFFAPYQLLASILAGATVDLLTVVSRVIAPEAFLNVVLAVPATQLALALRRALFPPEVELG